jgi:hypothetical protein
MADDLERSSAELDLLRKRRELTVWTVRSVLLLAAMAVWVIGLVVALVARAF